MAGSDGAGEVIAIGARVNRFSIGDRVMPYLFNTYYAGGSAPPIEARNSTFGGTLDGVFRHFGVFTQESLVSVPNGLSYEQGATIQGPFATSWNALMGGSSRLQVGDSVLVQGSGIVSIATIQLAVAAGATVIATTSSHDKRKRLEQLGVQHVINYVEDLEWGVTAKKLSPGGLGVKFVIDVVGDPNSYQQSLEAVAAGGEIATVGFMGTAAAAGKPGPSFFETILKPCSIRGVQVASRTQLEEVCRAIQTSGIQPIFDSHVFELEHLKDAYAYLANQKNFGKVIVKIT